MDHSAKETTFNSRRQILASLPTEQDNAPFFSKRKSSFRDCHHWNMSQEERIQWISNTSPVLGALRVFNCGIFVEAHGHWWERSNQPEGILIYCTDGKGGYQQGDRTWTIETGDLLYCPPLTQHRYWADKDQPWTICWMHLSGEQLPHYEQLLGLGKAGPVRHIGVHHDIIDDFTRLVNNPPSPVNESRWFGIQAKAITVLGHIATLPHNISDILEAYGPIQKAIALMTASLDAPFDLPRFAREAGCSIGHFTRRFTKVIGQPPRDWFIQQKMERACMLLSVPHARVKDVAARLNYPDPLYFNRLFKRIIGVPPGQYRQSLSEDDSLSPHRLWQDGPR